MNFGRWVRMSLGVAPLLAGLAGCGSFWQAPSSSSSGSGSGSGTTLTSGNFYILNAPTGATNTVSGYFIDAGTLTPFTNSPYAVNGLAFSMAVDPTGSFAYVSSTNGIYLYPIDSSTGALTLGAQVAQDIQAASIAIDPTDKWLLDASDLGTISAIPIVSNGTLDTSRSIQTLPMDGLAVQHMAISPNGRLIAVALGSNGTQVFSFNAANAAPLSTGSSPIAVVNSTSGSSVAVAFDPQSRLLYIGETSVFPTSTTSPGGIRAFSIGATSLTQISGSPYASGGTGPHSILAEGTGNYVYVANWMGTSSGSIAGFQVAASGTSYTLTALSSTATTGVEPTSLAEDNKGEFVFAVSTGGSPGFSAFTFDTTTASKLDLALTSNSTGSSPATIVATP